MYVRVLAAKIVREGLFESRHVYVSGLCQRLVILWMHNPTIRSRDYGRMNFEVRIPNLHWLWRESAAFYRLSKRTMIEIENRKCYISYQSQAEAWLERLEKEGVLRYSLPCFRKTRSKGLALFMPEKAPLPRESSNT